VIYGVQIEDKFLVLASMPRRLVFCGWSLPVIASGTPSPLQQVGSVRPGRWALGVRRKQANGRYVRQQGRVRTPRNRYIDGRPKGFCGGKCTVLHSVIPYDVH